jgi:hypothetical protein
VLVSSSWYSRWYRIDLGALLVDESDEDRRWRTAWPPNRGGAPAGPGSEEGEERVLLNGVVPTVYRLAAREDSCDESKGRPAHSVRRVCRVRQQGEGGAGCTGLRSSPRRASIGGEEETLSHC